jgi:arylsulfatase A-like enzyme
VSGSGGLQILASTDEDHLEGRAPTQLLQEPLRATGRKVEVDLSGFGDIPTRLELRVRGSAEADSATIRQLDVVARRNIRVDRRERKLRNVYLFALEGARPDDLFQKGDPPLRALEDLRATSLVFERAHSLGAAAVPSHASLLSSVVPPGHLTTRGTYVAESRTMLPELLDRAGYFNVGLSANGDVTAERGLVQGMADHQVVPRTTTRTHDAEGIVRRMLEQVDTRPEPRFIYATMNDAQAPYDPPSELIADVGVVPDPPSELIADVGVVPEGAPVQHRTHMWVGNVRLGNVVPTDEQLHYVRRLYRGELQVVDRALADFMEGLRQRGELDSSIIIVVGIHGEEFLEHGGAGHGFTLYEESIHVPLAIRAPELLDPDTVSVPVDLLDLGPTIADLLGIQPPANWNGESLVSLIDDPTPPPRLLTAYLGDGSRAGIIGHYKLIVGRGRGPGSQRLYDLAADAEEAEDLLDPSHGRSGGIALRMLRTALAWESPETPSWDRARWGTGANLRPAYALDHGM